MFRVIGHSKCPYCKQAIQSLATHGKSFLYTDAFEYPEVRQRLKASGYSTVPAVYLNDRLLGGFEALETYLQEHPDAN